MRFSLKIISCFYYYEINTRLVRKVTGTYVSNQSLQRNVHVKQFSFYRIELCNENCNEKAVITIVNGIQKAIVMQSIQCWDCCTVSTLIINEIILYSFLILVTLSNTKILLKFFDNLLNYTFCCDYYVWGAVKDKFSFFKAYSKKRSYLVDPLPSYYTCET